MFRGQCAYMVCFLLMAREPWMGAFVVSHWATCFGASCLRTVLLRSGKVILHWATQGHAEGNSIVSLTSSCLEMKGGGRRLAVFGSRSITTAVKREEGRKFC